MLIQTRATAASLILSLFLNVSPALATENIEEVLPGSRGTTTNAATKSFESWTLFQYERAQTGLLANISPDGAARGAVIASPSRSYPDYFWHWIRDAALVMDTVLNLHAREKNVLKREQYLSILRDFTHFSRQNQLTPNRSGSPTDTGLGEPKFHADGRAFDEDWGRPQNDGPPLRAITLIRYARLLLKQGEADFVKNTLYDGRIPTHSVIKADLEFVAHHWGAASYDLWEEVLGHHFYTRLVQRRALVEGAKFADEMGDPGAAAYYRSEARKLEAAIALHWDAQNKFVMNTLGYTGGIHYKYSNLDISVILAAFHARGDDGYYAPEDDRILATAARLEKQFSKMYRVNQRALDHDGLSMAPAIGRYPEDQYNGGHGGPGGNPWVLTTAVMAELNYTLAAALEKRGSLAVTKKNQLFFQQKIEGGRALLPGRVLSGGSSEFSRLVQNLRSRGDEYLRRVRHHANPDGSLSEQMERYTGTMHGARDLTWSYASFLTAFWAR
jgi:glucoamylase